jgi:DNA/RNA-binding domain of Phe-tRNA-synthetase-like protein
LSLLWLTLPARRRRSPAPLVRRLRELSDRYRGAGVVAMRTQPIPRAYRSFFRQIGLDPDVDRIPSERAAVARLLQGGFRPIDLISDACLLALLETGVPVWALDAARVSSGLGIRLVGEPGPGHPIPGMIAVADAETVHAPLFGDPLDGHGVGARTERVILFALSVEGVPAIHVEEALWISVDILEGASSSPDRGPEDSPPADLY